jgi:DNA-binding response OmpR family regulator/PAS domain-containing protein
MAISSADRDAMWLNGLPAPLALFDGEARLVFANSAWALATGTAAGLGVGKPIGAALSALGPISDSTRLAQQLQRVCEGKAKTSRVEVVCVDLTIDTVQRILEFIIQRMPDKSPFGAMAAVSLNDVTEARHAHERIARAEARLMALADQSENGLILLDEAGAATLVTAAACALLGIKEAVSSLHGLKLAELAERAGQLPTGDRQRLAKLAAGEGLSTELLAMKRVAIAADEGDAGSMITIEATSTAKPLPAQAEKEHHLVRTQLIETIGHELAVVLEGATSASIRAEQMELDPSVVDYLERIRGAAEASLSGIGSLVAATRHSQRQAEVRPAPFELRAFIADLVKQVVLTAEAHGVALRVKVEQDVADAVESDVERLRLALKTLLECAISAPRVGEVQLQVAPEFFSENAMTARFAVTAKLTHGEAESQPHHSTRFAIAQFALNALASDVKSSATAHGSQHEFLLSMRVRHEIVPRSRPTYVSLHGLAVLIVSSNPKQRLQLANWLKTARLLPLEADNAAMALALLTRLAEEGNPVPLVILENQLPIQDGFLLAFRIRNDERLGNTLVVMLANQGRPGDAIACRENGISAYLPQPVPKARLLEAISAVTGAGEDARDVGTSTEVLVTRHTLREERSGPTVLVIENDIDETHRVEDAFKRADGIVAVAHTWADGLAQAGADVFDIVIVRLQLLQDEPGAAIAQLRSRLLRNSESTPVFALSPTYSLTLDQECKSQGYTGVMLKPTERDELITLALKISRQGVKRRTASE